MNKPWWWIIVSVSVFFRWYDLWVGIYIDTKGRAVYICPVPMLGVKIVWRPSPAPYDIRKWM